MYNEKNATSVIFKNCSWTYEMTANIGHNIIKSFINNRSNITAQFYLPNDLIIKYIITKNTKLTKIVHIAIYP